MIKIILFMFISSFVISSFVTFLFGSMNGGLPVSLCLPFIDPLGSSNILKVITWFVIISQTLSSLSMIFMHLKLVFYLQSSQETIKEARSKKLSFLPLILQLVLITFSNILCWFPTNCVYISTMFLSRYPTDLIYWITIVGLPLNSVVNPLIFSFVAVRKIILEHRTKPDTSSIKHYSDQSHLANN